MQAKTRTFSAVLGDSKCECADKGCPVHTSVSKCSELGTTILYRVDMEDVNGTVFCDDCANDATMSGLLVEWNDPELEDEEPTCACGSYDKGECEQCDKQPEVLHGAAQFEDARDAQQAKQPR